MISTPMSAYKFMRALGLSHGVADALTRDRYVFEYALRCFGINPL